MTDNEFINAAIKDARNFEAQRDAAWAEDRAIREAIKAHPDEATIDEVRRLVAERDGLKWKITVLAEANKRLGAMIVEDQELISIGAKQPSGKDKDAACSIGNGKG